MGVRGAPDTIFAIATGAGRSALQVIRLSGSGTKPLLAKLCGHPPPPRRASLRRLGDAAGRPLDQAIVLWFPAPGSYTGEDCAELHLHGGIAVRDAVIGTLLDLGARPAEAGEFTRRAVLNGRFDLTEAEAVADLIDAETDAQRRQALNQLDGGLSTILAGWADTLRRHLAIAEALIDFPEETGHSALPIAPLIRLADDMAAMLAERAPEHVRTGLVVAITGAPNAGKSSLINYLAGRDVAIVSPLPGTTRDIVEARLILNGMVVTFLDTAGLRPTEHPIEAEGVRRARDRAASADLVIHLTEAGSRLAVPPPATPAPVIHVTSKCDIGAALPQTCPISLTGSPGMDGLYATLRRALAHLTDRSAPVGLSRERHRAALTQSAAALRDALAAIEPEITAEALRRSLWELGRITGTTDIERVLDEIFVNFCIGK